MRGLVRDTEIGTIMSDDEDNWTRWWDARAVALEAVLGPSDGMVGHAMIPFDLGAEVGGAADILYFRGHLRGIVATTAALIGRDDQVPSPLGNYELMICARDDIEWGADLISRLAHYTLTAVIAPGETMDIGFATPAGSTTAALLFLEYARFVIDDRAAGLLLCIGITAGELNACRGGHRAAVEASLKAEGVFPFTDLYRASALDARKSPA